MGASPDLNSDRSNETEDGPLRIENKALAINGRIVCECRGTLRGMQECLRSSAEMSQVMSAKRGYDVSVQRLFESERKAQVKAVFHARMQCAASGLTALVQNLGGGAEVGLVYHGIVGGGQG